MPPCIFISWFIGLSVCQLIDLSVMLPWISIEIKVFKQNVRGIGWCVKKIGVAISNSLTRTYVNSSKSVKNYMFEIFSISRFSLVGLVGREEVVGISNSFYIVLVPLLASIPNFIQIEQKTQNLEIFSICRLWLVGLVSRKMS